MKGHGNLSLGREIHRHGDTTSLPFLRMEIKVNKIYSNITKSLHIYAIKCQFYYKNEFMNEWSRCGLNPPSAEICSS